jgi:hypothetical protein
MKDHFEWNIKCDMRGWSEISDTGGWNCNRLGLAPSSFCRIMLNKNKIIEGEMKCGVHLWRSKPGVRILARPDNRWTTELDIWLLIWFKISRIILINRLFRLSILCINCLFHWFCIFSLGFGRSLATCCRTLRDTQISSAVMCARTISSFAVLSCTGPYIYI